MAPCTNWLWVWGSPGPVLVMVIGGTVPRRSQPSTLLSGQSHRQGDGLCPQRFRAGMFAKTWGKKKINHQFTESPGPCPVRAGGWFWAWAGSEHLVLTSALPGSSHQVSQSPIGRAGPPRACSCSFSPTTETCRGRSEAKEVVLICNPWECPLMSSWGFSPLPFLPWEGGSLTWQQFWT